MKAFLAGSLLLLATAGSAAEETLIDGEPAIVLLEPKDGSTVQALTQVKFRFKVHPSLPPGDVMLLVACPGDALWRQRIPGPPFTALITIPTDESCKGPIPVAAMYAKRGGGALPGPKFQLTFLPPPVAPQ